MTSIQVERRAHAPIINFMTKIKQNEEGLHFHSIKSCQFIVEKGIAIKNLKIARK